MRQPRPQAQHANRPSRLTLASAQYHIRVALAAIVHIQFNQATLTGHWEVAHGLALAHG